MYVFGSADQNTAYTFMSKVGGPLANKKVEKVVYSNSEQSGQNFAIALTSSYRPPTHESCIQGLFVALLATRAIFLHDSADKSSEFLFFE